MAITARSWKRSSDIVDLEQVLIHFISKNDRSASAIMMGRQDSIWDLSFGGEVLSGRRRQAS